MLRPFENSPPYPLQVGHKKCLEQNNSFFRFAEFRQDNIGAYNDIADQLINFKCKHTYTKSQTNIGTGVYKQCSSMDKGQHLPKLLFF